MSDTPEHTSAPWAAPLAQSKAAVSGAGVSLTRMVAIGLGNALEFYDFMIFSFFAVQIGHAFFPAQLGARGLLYTLEPLAWASSHGPSVGS